MERNGMEWQDRKMDGWMDGWMEMWVGCLDGYVRVPVAKLVGVSGPAGCLVATWIKERMDELRKWIDKRNW